MHLGMTGWVHIKSDPSSHYKAEKKDTQWPPKFAKFIATIKRDSDGVEDELAFADARRLGRIRLITPSEDKSMRDVSPLVENGPDPVQEPPELSWVVQKLGSKKVPVKTWLLDQAILAGIGNWVGDEILYHARIHPQHYTHELSEEEASELHKALINVTKIAVETEAESERFPKDWLMLYRWGKGKKGKAPLMPSGETVNFVDVGGRTSAYVKERQKLSGREVKKEAAKKEANGDKEEGAGEKDKETSPAKRKSGKSSRGRRVKEEKEEAQPEENKPTSSSKRKAKPEVDGEDERKQDGHKDVSKPKRVKQQTKAEGKSTTEGVEEVASGLLRRSSRKSTGSQA